MTPVIVVGVTLQFALYAEPYQLHWFKLDWFNGTLPWIIALGLVVSFMIGAFSEAGRMVGASMLVNIALGTCHRPKREQLWASKVHDLITLASSLISRRRSQIIARRCMPTSATR